ncbi:hypothetical protein HPB47_011060 [Ixodes persulcatus]|uniref:Uncharacterized protein n=1 Tax=Ixodes persulcatus TaxID=34615 RepID=A0AC60NXF6_IXOPE|nr:hypothetical protein HPB47_011060 [Ixodes persulcatus]
MILYVKTGMIKAGHSCGVRETITNAGRQGLKLPKSASVQKRTSATTTSVALDVGQLECGFRDVTETTAELTITEAEAEGSVLLLSYSEAVAVVALLSCYCSAIEGGGLVPVDRSDIVERAVTSLREFTAMPDLSRLLLPLWYLEIVLEMAHPVERGLSPLGGPLSRLLASLGNNHPMAGLMIFRLGDVMSLVAPNADLDYATRDSFTDTAISKFNGQPLEKPLEPWLDGGLEGDALVLDDVAPDGDDTNGWDANEMFKTNAEKYGVTTSYDSALSGYTVKLEPKNTDEYKLQEAKACKIAQEIENNPVFKKRTDLENGDEEDKFSAVVRPSTDPSPPGARYVRRKPLGGPKPLRGTPPPPGGGLPRGGLPSFKGGPPLGSPSPAKTAPHPKHGPPAASQAPPGTHPFPDLDPASSPRVNGGGYVG